MLPFGRLTLTNWCAFASLLHVTLYIWLLLRLEVIKPEILKGNVAYVTVKSCLKLIVMEVTLALSTFLYLYVSYTVQY